MHAIDLGLGTVLSKCGQPVFSGRIELEGFDRDGTPSLTGRQFEGFQEFPKHINLLTDSRSAVEALKEGPDAQKHGVGTNIWSTIKSLTENGSTVHIQWIPGHSNIQGNEYVDRIAAIGAQMSQGNKCVPIEAAKAKVWQWAKQDEGQQYQQRVEVSDGVGKSRGGTAWHNKATGGWGKVKNIDDLDDSDKRTIRQLRVGECLESRVCAARVNNNIDANCPTCKTPQTLQHMLLDCKDAEVKYWKTKAWGTDLPTEPAQLFADSKRLLSYWGSYPVRLKAPLH